MVEPIYIQNDKQLKEFRKLLNTIKEHTGAKTANVLIIAMKLYLQKIKAEKI